MLSRMSPRTAQWAAGAAALGLLLLAYLPLLQAIPNGSDHYFMMDVGETQIVLNVWGTLHATGYPLYVLTGAPIVASLRGAGVNPAEAPAIVSLMTMLAALGFAYALALRASGRPWLAAAAIIAFGLTRTAWIHAEIAEVYALMLLLLAAMLWIALAQRRAETDERRLYLLALLGGLGVAHHRALALAIPALLFAMWPVFAANPRALPKRLAICLLLGLLGFLPYLWLPLRAQAGASWVYGDPGTLDGFLTQFLGREYTRFIAPPLSPAELWANAEMVVRVLILDLTLPGLLAGVIGLAIGLFQPRLRRAAAMLLLLAGSAFAFHAAAYTDVLSALILMITLPIALGWALLVAAIVPSLQPSSSERAAVDLRAGDSPSPRPSWREGAKAQNRIVRLALTLTAAALFATFSASLFAQNRAFIESLISDPTGLNIIRMAQGAPPDSTLMIPWGPRYFAAAFARDVLDTLPADLQLIDHRADFAALIASDRPLLTPASTFYNQPASWWQEQTGAPVWLTAASPGLVQIAAAPQLADAAAPTLSALPVPQAATLICRDGLIYLIVDWAASATPAENWSVFVHGLDADGTLLITGDQSAPVFGWRPLTGWAANELVRDIYTVEHLPDLIEISYGFYRQRADGSFENADSYRMLIDCETTS